MIIYNFNQLTETPNSISYYTSNSFAHSHIIIDFTSNQKTTSLESYDLIQNIMSYIDFNFCKHLDSITDIKGYIFEYIKRRKPHLNIVREEYQSRNYITFHKYEIYNKQDNTTLININLTQILYN